MANRRALSKLLSFAAALPSFLLLLVLGLPSDTVIGHSNVESLPGYNGRLPFELETGYIGVGEDNDVQLFYYFIKSDRNPLEDPVILWTTGGPGCSAFSGLAFEIGPFSFKRAKYDGTLPTLVPNPYSWTKISNIIFLDAPVWTGFSYSRSSRDSYNEDRKSAKQSYDFLRKWLIKHPEFLSNPLYIGGDSYSGLTSPMITLLVSNGNKAGNEPVMNLKGYLLGNPATDRIIEGNSKIPFAHGMGLISNELYELTKKTCGEDYVNVAPSNRECIKALKAVQECTNGLNDKHILEPLCALTAPKPNEIGQRRRSLNDNSSKFSLLDPPATPELRCRAYDHMLSYYWANDDRVQEALNIRKGIVQEWKRCNRSLNYTKGQSSLNYHIILSNRGYRSLIYSGDHDLIVPFLSTQAWIKSLNYSIVDDWRPWVVDGQVGGYTRTYANNMTFATVKGAGHTAPQYRPAESFAMFERWISHDPL